MAGKPEHAFTSPELHRVYHSPGLSYIPSRTILMQNLHSMSANKDKENPGLSAHRNSSQSSASSVNSSAEAQQGKDPRTSKNLISTIVRETLGLACATAVAPFERAYLMMQCQNEMIKAGRLSSPYNGMKDCLLRTIKHEGVMSLWRGNSLNVIKVIGMTAFPFAVVHVPYQNYMSKKIDESPFWMLPFSIMPNFLWLHPVDYARVRLANDVKAAGGLQFSFDSSGKHRSNDLRKRQFNGVFDVFKKTLKSDGIGGLYRGYTFRCLGSLTFFTYFRAVKDVGAPNGKEKQNQKIPRIVTFGLIWLSCAVVLYPFVTVSRRMMMTSGEAKKYRGAVDAIYHIVKNEGVSSFYKGFNAFVTYDTAKNAAFFAILSSTTFGGLLN